jgi:hypothetical protein
MKWEVSSCNSLSKMLIGPSDYRNTISRSPGGQKRALYLPPSQMLATVQTKKMRAALQGVGVGHAPVIFHATLEMVQNVEDGHPWGLDQAG